MQVSGLTVTRNTCMRDWGIRTDIGALGLMHGVDATAGEQEREAV